MKALVALLIATMFPLVAAISREVEPGDQVPLGDRSEGTMEALNRLRFSLEPLHPEKTQAPQVLETKDGIYIVYGRLFQTDAVYALAALSHGGNPGTREYNVHDRTGYPIGLGLAEWVRGEWEPRALWRIWPVWRPKGWNPDNRADHLNATPAQRPFWLKNFGGDGLPKMVVVGQIGKCCQEFYLLNFDSKSQSVEKIADAMAEPKMMDGWIQLYHRSPRLSEWETWTYYGWNDGRLVKRAEWGSFYNMRTDESSNEVSRTTSEGKTVRFEIKGTDHGTVINGDGHPSALFEVDFHPLPDRSKPHIDQGSDAYAIDAYLFEKCTGLPRRLCPLPEDVKLRGPLEKIASVHVKGDEATVRLLSP